MLPIVHTVYLTAPILMESPTCNINACIHTMYFMQWGCRKRGSWRGCMQTLCAPLLRETELASAVSSTWVGVATDATWRVQRKSDTTTFFYPHFLVPLNVGSNAKPQSSMISVRPIRKTAKMADDTQNFADHRTRTYTVRNDPAVQHNSKLSASSSAKIVTSNHQSYEYIMEHVD
jgi:hypothetical protein